MEELNMDHEHIYDTIVVGFGPAGLNAALYLKRKGIDVAIMGRQRGGQVADTSSVENYLGFENITGFGLVEEFAKHVLMLGIPKVEYYGVTEVKKENDIFSVKCEDENTYRARTLIIATGSKPRKLGIPGEEKLYGRGVTYCATCDGPLYRGKKVVVAGGGNSAVEAAIDLSKICGKVTLVHRSTFRADKILLDALDKIENVEILLGTTITEIIGDMGVDAIRTKNRETGEERTIKTDGVFVEIGYTPNTEIVKDLIALNDSSEITVDENLMTSVPGIFAAGDVTDEKHKQIIVAAGMGAKAALALNDYITKMQI